MRKSFFQAAVGALLVFFIYPAAAEKRFRIEATADSFLTISPEGSRIIVVYKKGAQWDLNLDGKILVTGMDEARTDARFSPNGKSYLLKYKKNGREFVLHNGKTYGGRGPIGDVTASPDLSRFSFAFYTGNADWVNIDGRDWGPYTTAHAPVFSENWKSVAFVYNQGAKTGDYSEVIGGKWYAVINGRTLGPYEAAMAPAFSPDGARFGFWFTQGGRHRLNLDGKVAAEMDMTAIYPGTTLLAFSGKDGAAAFPFVRDGQYFCSIAGKTHGPFPGAVVPRLTPGGRFHFVYRGGAEGEARRSYLNVDGLVLGPYETVFAPQIWSPDESRFAFLFREKNAEFFQVDEKVYGPYERVYNPAFSADGRLFGFWFKKAGKYYVQIGDKTEGGWAEGYNVHFERLEGPVIFSADRYWASLNDELKFVTINGVPFGPLQSFTDPAASADGSTVGFSYRDGDTYRFFVNGAVRSSFPTSENTLGLVFFSPQGKRQGYSFRRANDNREYLWIDGVTYGPFDFSLGPYFTPNDAHFVFTFREAGPEFVNVGGKAFLNVDGKPYGGGSDVDFTVTPDNRVYAAYIWDQYVYVDVIK